jgi:lipooligosaccharide transport system permease protein
MTAVATVRRAPTGLAPALSVLEFDLVGYKRTWRGSVLSSFVLPVLFVIGFGLSVGHYVDAGGKLGNVSYLDFVVPGMLASTALQLGFGESTYQLMSRFQWIRTYHAMVATPLRVGDLLAGDLMFLSLRLISTSAVFLAITAAFGGVHSWWAVTAPFVCVFIGLSMAVPLMAYAASVDNDGFFALIQRFLVIPMTLFAGVFYPVSQLPVGVRVLAYVSPLWHGVQVCRAATLPGYGVPWWAIVGHLAYLIAWALVGFLIAVRAYRRKLVV